MTRLTVRAYSVRESERLAQQGLHPVMARLMVARGLNSPDQWASEISGLIPPNQLTHVDQAAIFLADAIEAKKN
jgi:single-stranded-DNA-specific exonuclease